MLQIRCVFNTDLREHYAFVPLHTVVIMMRDRKGLVCLVICVVISHWVGLLPVALAGAWHRYFVPFSLSALQSVLVNIFPILVMAVLFWVRKSHKWLWFVPLIYLVVLFIYGWPQMSVIAKDAGISPWKILVPSMWVPWTYTVVSSIIFTVFIRNFDKLKAGMYRNENTSGL